MTEVAARRLTEDGEAVERAYAERHFLPLPATPMRYVEKDRRSVQWEEVSSIQRPEFYMVGNTVEGSSFIWLGILILDHEKGVGYIQAFGD